MKPLVSAVARLSRARADVLAMLTLFSTGPWQLLVPLKL